MPLQLVQPAGRCSTEPNCSTGKLELRELRGVDLVRLAAAVAEAARETLGDDGLERRSDEERLDADLGETGDGARRVVGVQGREHEVAGQRRLDRDLRGLVVADLTDQHDIRVGSQDRPQRAGEREAGLRVHLHLVDAGHAVLDRVLDRDDVDLGLRDRVQRRVQRRRLARTGRAR